MTVEQIETALAKQTGRTFDIRFRGRSPIKGLFLQLTDYKELSKKNLWRIVSEGRMGEYSHSKDDSLARIFNGQEFTKMEPAR